MATVQSDLCFELVLVVDVDRKGRALQSPGSSPMKLVGQVCLGLDGIAKVFRGIGGVELYKPIAKGLVGEDQIFHQFF